jgi:large subunit ribosomal protein L7/L12
MILQERLNIPDMPMGGFVGGGGGAAPAAAPVEEEEAAPAAAEKTMFNLKLEKFDAGAKPKVIKEIKAMLGLSLVDSTPKLMKEGVAKEEAEKIVETLKALGATVSME